MVLSQHVEYNLRDAVMNGCFDVLKLDKPVSKVSKLGDVGARDLIFIPIDT